MTPVVDEGELLAMADFSLRDYMAQAEVVFKKELRNLTVNQEAPAPTAAENDGPKEVMPDLSSMGVVGSLGATHARGE